MQSSQIPLYDIFDSLPVEGRRFIGESEFGNYGNDRYVVILPLVPVSEEIKGILKEYWFPHKDVSPNGYFIFIHGKSSVADSWHGHSGGWAAWEKADMLLTQKSVIFRKEFPELEIPSDLDSVIANQLIHTLKTLCSEDLYSAEKFVRDVLGRVGDWVFSNRNVPPKRQKELDS